MLSALKLEIVETRGLDFMIVSWPTSRPKARALTAAERDILRAIANGLSNGEIARSRGTSKRTVANQIAMLLSKFAVRSRHQLPRAVAESRR